MANALQQQMADGIASLVRKQTFSGSGVWRQSGNATLRIKTQTDSIVEALQRLPSQETQDEEERESDRQHEELINAIESDGSSGDSGEDSKKGGFLKKMLSGIVGFPIKMIKGLFSALGSVGKLFLKFGAFLLKPFAFLGTLGAALTSTAALVTGLGAIAALFAGVGVASFMLTDAEFDKLKEDIAKGVANVFSKIVSGAVDIYNAFVPESMQVSEADKQKFETATFTAVKDTIISIIDFVKDISDAFGEAFMKNFDGITKKFDDFVTKIGQVYDKITALLADAFEDAGGKNTLMSVVTLIGDGIGKVIDGILSVANFLLDLIIDPKTTLKNLGDDIGKFFSDIGTNIKNFFKESIDNFTTKIKNFFSEIFSIDTDAILATIAPEGGLLRKALDATGLTEQSQEKELEEIETAIKGALDRISRSEGGENVYFGREGKGREEDAEKIQELELRKAGIIKGSRQTGGRISETGLYKLHSGEIVFDRPSSDRIDNFVASYLPQSGAVINGLQMDRTMGGMTGSAAPVVIDNSQQPTIINQTNVAAPQTRGPALVGEGRDKVNMR